MKRDSFVLFIVCTLLFVSSCMSNEQKSMKLIEAELFRTLYDFDSYQPVETSIDSAFFSPYTDYQALSLALDVDKETKRYNQLREQADYQHQLTMSSRYSLSLMRERMEKSKQIGEEWIESGRRLDSFSDSLMKVCARITPDYMGWKVVHRYRCKDKSGNYEITDHLFIIDKDFTKIIFDEHLDDEGYKTATDIINVVIKVVEEKRDSLLNS